MSSELVPGLYSLIKQINLPSSDGRNIAEVMTMTRNQWTWLLVAATLLVAAGIIAQLFWPPAMP
jgi:hypothetical protein